jgi:hypothetical protein
MLEFGLRVQVEDLKNVTCGLIGCFQRDNVLASVHNCAINFATWSSNDVHFIGQFNDADLRCTLSIFISDTHIFFGLQTGNSEFKEAWVNSQIGKIGKFTMPKWICLHF